MAQDNLPVSQTAARDYWNQARRKAFWQKFSRALGFSRQPTDLLSFEDVQHTLRLAQNTYRGLQVVPLDKIVGSVGRYHDFTRTFLPLVESDGPRWQRIAELQMETGLPPIELYKVGEAYFVKDGNHRVSVARQFGATTIEAYVWEYETPVRGVAADGQIDDLITKAEYRAFLDRTHLDISHPEQEIILTEPGMYPALELEIELYRENLQRIDGEPRSYPEASALWYDMVYTLAVDVIRGAGALGIFPGRTEADLYVWVTRHRKELEEQYGTRVSLRDAVTQIAEEQQQRKAGTVERVVETAARSVVDLVRSLATPSREETQQFIIPPNPHEPLGKLLAEMSQCEPAMAYQGQRGDAWREWRAALRAKVTELLDVKYTPADHVPVEILETNVIRGVEQVKIHLEAADGLTLPGYVMYPVDRVGRLPGLLIYTGHGTIRQTAGLEHSPHKYNALALAQAGYVTLTFEERGLGELGQVDHLALDNVARLMGRTWLGIILEDGLRALDYLQSRDDVKPAHLGVTGLGLGGGLALYTAALDERARAVVVQNYLGGDIDPVAVQGHGCDFVPSLRRYANLSDVARLIVPRPVLYAYPEALSTTHAARVWFDKVRPTYEAFRCPDRTNFIVHEKGAVYRRVMARNWFDRWLTEEEDTSVLLWAPHE
jgi:dienelactone hydrolase